jgi:23S rRNA (guanine745-N1)-methyltransferase
MPVTITVLCPVRGCGTPLERGNQSWACGYGHVFDVARSGYCNLLQPQDRRSKNPGDPKEAVLARRRFLEAGHGDFLLQALSEEMEGLPDDPAILDVGCGEGYFLGSLAREREAHGVDLSVPAIDLAARRWPDVSWWVVNADRSDRGLPFADGSFDLALSIAGRRPSGELRRVLKPGGRLLVAVPAEDDLIELREAVQGEGVLRSRLEKTIEELSGDFELETHRTVRTREALDAEAVRDVLASTYRGARASQRERVDGIGRMEVTLSFELARFRPIAR